jgi:hypothetical protein
MVYGNEKSEPEQLIENKGPRSGPIFVENEPEYFAENKQH